MIINEDFWDNLEDKDELVKSSHEHAEDYTDTTDYKYFVLFKVQRWDNVTPSVDSFNIFNKAVRHFLSTAGIVSACSEQPEYYDNMLAPIYGEEYGTQKTVSEMITASVNYIKYSINFHTPRPSLYVKKIYDLLRNILLNTVKKDTFFTGTYYMNTLIFFGNDDHWTFTSYDFGTTRREEDVFKKFTELYKNIIGPDYDYDQLKICMGLDTVKQMSHIAIYSQHNGYKFTDITLSVTDSNGFYDAKSLPDKFYIEISDYDFYTEPKLEKAERFAPKSDKDYLIKWIREAADNSIKVKPFLVIASRGNSIYFITAFVFNKTYPRNGRFSVVSHHSFKYNPKEKLERFNSIQLAYVLKPFIIAGETPDDLTTKLKPYIDKVFKEPEKAVKEIKNTLTPKTK